MEGGREREGGREGEGEREGGRGGGGGGEGGGRGGEVMGWRDDEERGEIGGALQDSCIVLRCICTSCTGGVTSQ